MRKMAKLFANSGDPDQMQHSVEGDLGLHCLPITLLRVSRLQRANDGGKMLHAKRENHYITGQGPNRVC